MNLLGLHPIQVKVAKYCSYKKDADTEYFDDLIKRDIKVDFLTKMDYRYHGI